MEGEDDHHIGEIQDYREDPEGMTFAPEVMAMLPEKLQRIQAHLSSPRHACGLRREARAFDKVRIKLFGHRIQGRAQLASILD